MFFLDLHHILTIDEVHKRPFGHYLTVLFYRYSPELYYRRDVTFFDNQLMPQGWLHPAREARPEELGTVEGDVAVYPPQFHFWHMGWVGNVETIEAHLLKTTYSRVLRVKWVEANTPEKLSRLDKRLWFPMATWSEEEILNYWHTYHKIWTRVFDESVGERCVPYEWHSPLKELVIRHPFWGRDRTWFGFEEAL